jgi:hypothetical protein
LRNGKPLCVELFCGCFGWSAGWLAEGGIAIGFDIEHFEHHGPVPDGAMLVLQDVLTLHGSQFKDADLILASPPCVKYSWLAMPWSRSKDPNNSKAAKALRAKWEAEGPDNRLFDACFRIQREAVYARRLDLRCCPLDYSLPGCKRCHIPLIVENVRGAQPWVGRSVWNYGSFHLWGDVPALMPIQRAAPKVSGFRFDGSGCSFQSAAVKESGQKSAAGHCKSAVATERPGGRMIAGDVKNADGKWTSTVADGVKVAGHVNKRDGLKSTPHFTNQAEHDAVKVGGDWFRDPACHSAHASRSNARKAASAMIAKIPLPLSTWIARVYKP